LFAPRNDTFEGPVRDCSTALSDPCAVTINTGSARCEDIQLKPRIVAAGLQPTLASHRDAVGSGGAAIEVATQQALEVAGSDACDKAFIRLFDASARASAAALQRLHDAGAPIGRLAGAPISVKDLYDVAGFPTTAASATLHDAAPAAHDSPAVARVRAAGGVLIGHTNMSEFAFSGVGINPHFGTPANVATRSIDAAPRVPGGSTSGGAVSVAAGAALAALGSDTGGSIRIPAALHGLVGFKNTQRLTPLEGTVPLSSTLDTVCAITRDVADAITLHEILAQRTVQLDARPLAGWRLALPRTLLLDALDATVARALERSLQVLRAQGARIEDIELPELNEVAAINAGGGFAPPEAWAWHRKRLAERAAGYDPRVAMRIRRGETMGAADYIDLQHARARWISRMADAMRGFDAMLSPTLPIVAPEIAPLQANDDAFFAANGKLLRNPSMVNLLDGCALSLPCHCKDEMPVGLMVWSGALADDRVLSIGLAIEAALRSTRQPT
jgi:aspartyl-tRNA(Asn)/glutamyl-tRNA(Gln) amidotransferase subunit A